MVYSKKVSLFHTRSVRVVEGSFILFSEGFKELGDGDHGFLMLKPEVVGDRD